jgi:hypothetical protein
MMGMNAIMLKKEIRDKQTEIIGLIYLKMGGDQN